MTGDILRLSFLDLQSLPTVVFSAYVPAKNLNFSQEDCCLKSLVLMKYVVSNNLSINQVFQIFCLQS